MTQYMNEAVRLLEVHYAKLHGVVPDSISSELHTAGEESVDSLAEACRRIFAPTPADDIFEMLVTLRQDLIRRSYEYFDPYELSSEEIKEQVIHSENQRNAVLVIGRLLRRCKHRRPDMLDFYYKSAQTYAKKIIQQLDPEGTVDLPPAPEWRVWHQRDHERDDLIYHARKHGKQSFTQIAEELGISVNRVATIYRDLDWKRNGEDCDAHKRQREAPIIAEAVFHARIHDHRTYQSISAEFNLTPQRVRNIVKKRSKSLADSDK